SKQRLQPALFLLFAAITGQHLHVAGVRRGAVEDLRRERRPAHYFAQRGILEVRQTGSILFVREEQVPQTRGARLGLQLLDDGSWLPSFTCVDLFVIALLVRIYMLVHERAQASFKLMN